MPNRKDPLIARVRGEKLLTLQDASAKLGEPELGGLFGEALSHYSRVRPRRIYFDFPGTDSAFDITLPDGTLYNGKPAWVDGFSGILGIEFPQGQREPVYLSEDDWTLYPREAPTAVRLTTLTPATGQTARVFYSLPHTIDEGASTVPLLDEEILVNLTARLACLSLAGGAIEAKDSLIAADAVNYRDIAQRCQSLAKELLGLLPPEFRRDAQAPPAAASGWVDWDSRDQQGFPFVWHSARAR